MGHVALIDEFVGRVVGVLGCADTTRSVQDISLLLTQSERLLKTLERHRLGPIWCSAVPWALLKETTRPSDVQQTLADAQRAAAANVMLQEQAAREVSRVLRTAGVRHAFFKAIHLRRTVYEPAWLRPADDVDVLVSPSCRARAREALLANGFSYSEKPPPLTHEESLTWRGAHLDLHWKLFRPGRSRLEPADEVLDAASEVQGLPVPNPEHGLAIMILATALGDYVTGRLIRAVDIDRMVRQLAPDWTSVIDFIARLGLQPAAWLTLLWVQHWFETPIPEWAMKALAPGPLRRRYLRAWLELDPWKVHQTSEALARIAFSLPLHQRAGDALRAAVGRSLATVTHR